jgi:SAM-dependent methyltransferase
MAAQDDVNNDGLNRFRNRGAESLSHNSRSSLFLSSSDAEPVSIIVNKVSHLEDIEAVDVGCGIGHYDILLYRLLGESLKLTCLDGADDILNNLSVYLSRHGVRSFSSKVCTSAVFPFDRSSVDCIFTFTANHQFSLPALLDESSRTLKPGGYLFVYTGLYRKNEINAWREHSPQFGQKTEFLYSVDDMKGSIGAVTGLMVENVVFFAYNRFSAFEQYILHNKSSRSPSSALYTADELQKAFRGFPVDMQQVSKEADLIRWYDENVLFVIKKI